MKRKTNLFYLSGDESNFITFSNYGESLTGNFLATNWKMFPSRFLCLYIKYLDGNVEGRDSNFNFSIRKSNFIKYLSKYYENKMAFLRDLCIEQNLSIERNLLPLNYLLEALYSISDTNDNNNLNKKNYSDIDFSSKNADVKLCFVGDITEQDYNGTYTDIISIINSTDKPLGNIVYNPNIDEVSENCKETVLHGWAQNELEYEEQHTESGEFNVYSPIFDEETEEGGKYILSSRVTGIDLSLLNTKENPYIKFNVLIPLYDLVDISVTNSTIIDENVPISLELLNDSTVNNSEHYMKNIPLGLWMTDNVIELKQNKETGYSPAWSLLLSSQFKPFPYSQKMPSEITQGSIKEAFVTYAQVLMRQSTLLNKFDKVLVEINKINKRINDIESKLNTVGNSYTSDSLRMELINFEKYQQDQMKSFKDEVYSYMLNTWKGYIG